MRERSKRERADDRLESVVGTVATLLFGALFGAAAGFGCVYFITDGSLWMNVAVILVCAIACAFLAHRYGQEFWLNLREWLGWLP